MGRINGASMFACAGIGETYFSNAGIDVVVANELLENRAKFYRENHPSSNMIIGDITNDEIKNSFIEDMKKKGVRFLVATPPCQGFSNLGKNRNLDEKLVDERNFLIFSVLDVIDRTKVDYVMIENVATFLTMLFPYKHELHTIEEILKDRYSDEYEIEIKKLNAKFYGVPQSRTRAITIMYKKGLKWIWPEPQEIITLREVIGDLPSLEAGEDSGIKHHKAKKHNDREIECMKHTPTGKSAMKNDFYYPKKEDGTRIKGFNSTYKRMDWDSPASVITMNNGNIGSHGNVHPGRLLPDGTYSDARVLTILELLRVETLPDDWHIPDWASEALVRKVIGEAVPPMLGYNIVKGIEETQDSQTPIN